MKKEYLKIHNLSIAKELYNLVNNEILKDTNISPEKFWSGFDKTVHELAPKNKDLIEIRENLQKKIKTNTKTGERFFSIHQRSTPKPPYYFGHASCNGNH